MPVSHVGCAIQFVQGKCGGFGDVLLVLPTGCMTNWITEKSKVSEFKEEM